MKEGKVSPGRSDLPCAIWILQCHALIARLCPLAPLHRERPQLTLRHHGQLGEALPPFPPSVHQLELLDDGLGGEDLQLLDDDGVHAVAGGGGASVDGFDHAAIRSAWKKEALYQRFLMNKNILSVNLVLLRMIFFSIQDYQIR